MGFLDKLRGTFKGKQKQIDKGIDKAADVVDDKTKGKHSDKIEGAAKKAKDIVDKVAGDEPPRS
jgi:hypothetical protein